MGERFKVEILGNRTVVMMDSIAYAEESDVGHIVVAGSHGGRSSGRFAIKFPLAACFLNDAGVGKENAGIASLTMLDDLGRCGATYDSQSARIGDCRDAWEHGVISHVNPHAAQLGFAPGEPVADAIRRVFGTVEQQRQTSNGNKLRVTIPGGRQVVLMDSTAYADPSDAGHLVVAGSHGGLAGKYGGEVRVAGIFLNDAGGGKNRAGISSLAVFDGIGVPAAAYSHHSARIGDAQDAWDNGVISFVNETAAVLGFVAGEPVQAAIRRVFGGASA